MPKLSDPAREMIRKNWHLFLVMLACLAGAAIMATWTESEASSDDVEALLPDDLQGNQILPPGPEVDTPDHINSAEEAKAVIADYKEVIASDPESDQAPPLVNAIGNLYRQKLMDYESAAEHYRWLISDYPDWPGTRGAYANLSYCYEKLGKKMEARELYREMLDVFPEGSEERNLAESKIY